jgi:hypothetical protein
MATAREEALRELVRRDPRYLALPQVRELLGLSAIAAKEQRRRTKTDGADRAREILGHPELWESLELQHEILGARAVVRLISNKDHLSRSDVFSPDVSIADVEVVRGPQNDAQRTVIQNASDLLEGLRDILGPPLGQGQGPREDLVAVDPALIKREYRQLLRLAPELRAWLTDAMAAARGAGQNPAEPKTRDRVFKRAVQKHAGSFDLKEVASLWDDAKQSEVALSAVMRLYSITDAQARRALRSATSLAQRRAQDRKRPRR